MTKREVGSVAVAVAVGVLVGFAFPPPVPRSQTKRHRIRPSQIKRRLTMAVSLALWDPAAVVRRAEARAKRFPTGPAPKMPDGKPDLQGVWNPANFSNSGGPFDLQPWAAALLKERRDNLRKRIPKVLPARRCPEDQQYNNC